MIDRESSCLHNLDQFGSDAIPRHAEALRSFLSRLEKGKELTHAQLAWLESMEISYSNENLKQHTEWLNSYDGSRRAIALLCAEYYSANPPYFSDLCLRVLSDPHNHKLTKKEYSRFCENKYTEKVLLQYEQDPKYEVGQMVSFRAKTKLNRLNDHGHRRLLSDELGQCALVLEIDARPITRAAKGARIYRVLPIGHTSTIYAHESDLKKMRKKMRKRDEN